jgi:hypothetical protein
VVTPTRIILRSADLLTPPMQDLYGSRWSRLNYAAVRLGSADELSRAQGAL